MRRRLYYRAFLKIPGWEYPRLEWFQALIYPNQVDEELTKIQTEHMANRLLGGWRLFIPFTIDWKVGEMYQLDYQI
jgi:hypothetical protein